MGRKPKGEKPISNTEAQRRSRRRAAVLKEKAKEAGYKPVTVWMRGDVKKALDQFVDSSAQFDVNDFIDALLTCSLIDKGINVSPPKNEIDPSHALFNISSYVTTHDEESIGWRGFNDVKLAAEVEVMKEEGQATTRVIELLNLINQAKGNKV